MDVKQKEETNSLIKRKKERKKTENNINRKRKGNNFRGKLGLHKILY